MASTGNVEGIVLRTREYSETDLLVTIYSKERGKFSAIAKGARKVKSSLRGAVQPFMCSRFAVLPGKNLFTLTQGAVINPYLGLRDDLEKLAYGSYLLELVQLGTEEHKVHADLYYLLQAALVLLELGRDAELTARFFELRFLDILGYRPYLESCANCRRRVQNSTFVLSPVKGGILCASCGGGTSLPTIHAGTVLMMEKLLQAPLTQLPNLKIGKSAKEEMNQALQSYLQYHIERFSKARGLLRQLLPEINVESHA